MLRLFLLMAAFGVASASVCAAAQPANSQPEGVVQGAERPQDFYLVGRAAADHLKIDYYLLGGPLSVTKRPVLRGAVLVNGLDDLKGPRQLVEILSITCATHEVRATFRIVYDGQGRLLSTTGAVDDPDDPGTMLTPAAARTTSDILCSGDFPQTTLHNRTLADFRTAAIPLDR